MSVYWNIYTPCICTCVSPLHVSSYDELRGTSNGHMPYHKSHTDTTLELRTHLSYHRHRESLYELLHEQMLQNLHHICDTWTEKTHHYDLIDVHWETQDQHKHVHRTHTGKPKIKTPADENMPHYKSYTILKNTINEENIIYL
jgi:hypothetical protein